MFGQVIWAWAMTVLIPFACGAVRALRADQGDNIAKLLLNFRLNSELMDQKVTVNETLLRNGHVLYGNLSNVGPIFPFQGLGVKVHTLRACKRKSLGLDESLQGKVAVLLMTDIAPYMGGCVSYDNQIRFAQDSGAIAIVVGRTSESNDVIHSPRMVSLVGIPVVLISCTQARRLHQLVNTAQQHKLHLNFALIPYTAQNQWPQPPIHQSFAASSLDTSLFLVLVILLFCGSVFIFIKLWWRRRQSHDLSMHDMAKSVMCNMETRKWVQPKRTGHSRRPVQTAHNMCSTSEHGSTLIGAGTASSISAGHNTCAICLEDYEPGNELRVLLCAHEFHKECVDPWLMMHQTCPLCQYDLVLHRYPTQSVACGVDDDHKQSSSFLMDMQLAVDPPLVPDLNYFCEQYFWRQSSAADQHSTRAMVNGRTRQHRTRCRRRDWSNAVPRHQVGSCRVLMYSAAEAEGECGTDGYMSDASASVNSAVCVVAQAAVHKTTRTHNLMKTAMPSQQSIALALHRNSVNVNMQVDNT